MTFKELETQVSEYVYGEDSGMLRIALASLISTRMKIGEPVWMILIGASSSGKSQVLRPLAMTDSKFIHRVDDITENTFLSGAKPGKAGGEVSFLKKVGSHGILVISDLTVLFSRNSESKAAILSQFRMIYDGEMVKHVGNSPKPIEWKGSLGVIAGSTPSIYGHFEEVADMGERFIYYRMKSYNTEKATRLSLDRKVFGKDLDDKLSKMYAEYVKDCVKGASNKPLNGLSSEVHERILQIAMFAAKLRTPAHYDKYLKQIDRVPISEMPMRVALQLSAIAKGLMVMSLNDTGSDVLNESDIGYVEWCAYSLANEERRACLKLLATVSWETPMATQDIADKMGLDTSITRMHLQHLTAIGILERKGGEGSFQWKYTRKEEYNIVKRLEGIASNEAYTISLMTSEDTSENDAFINAQWGEAS